MRSGCHGNQEQALNLHIVFFVILATEFILNSVTIYWVYTESASDFPSHPSWYPLWWKIWEKK